MAIKPRQPKPPTTDVTPVVADDTEPVITLTESQLDERVAAAVARALAAQPAPIAAVPTEAMSMRALMKEVMMEVIPATAVAMAQASGANNMTNSLAAAKLRQAKEEGCPCCRQSVAACGGAWVKDDKGAYVTDAKGRRTEDFSINHVRMVVFPRNEENANYFTGLRINGKVYASNGPDHAIWVPKVNDFAQVLSTFETGERRSRTPTKHMGSAGNGSVSGHGGIGRPGSPVLTQ